MLFKLFRIINFTPYRCKVLCEVAEGICCRAYFLKTIPDKSCITNPEWSKLRQKLEKSYPDVSDIAKVLYLFNYVCSDCFKMFIIIYLCLLFFLSFSLSVFYFLFLSICLSVCLVCISSLKVQGYDSFRASSSTILEEVQSIYDLFVDTSGLTSFLPFLLLVIFF